MHEKQSELKFSPTFKFSSDDCPEYEDISFTFEKCRGPEENKNAETPFSFCKEKQERSEKPKSLFLQNSEESLN